MKLRLKSKIYLLRESFLDVIRYVKYTPLSKPKEPSVSLSHLESDVIRMYHVIEKGLCMPDFRARFGRDIVRSLVSRLEVYDGVVAVENRSSHVCAARAVLWAYFDRHVPLGISVDDMIPDDFLQEEERSLAGGIRKLSQSEGNCSFSELMSSRSSVRSFKRGQIPSKQVIDGAIQIAIRAPSVCNRQAWRVHVYSGEKAQEVLRCQNGNRGFGHTIPTVLLVSVDLRLFVGVIERYQPWIEGGVFSMALTLALKSYDVESVSLNWSVVNSTDIKLRKVSLIPEYERVIMLIGCGYPNDECYVTVSHRDAVKKFVTYHE
jgi:nitroreductase